MKKSLLKVPAIALAVSMVLGLAACGGGGGSTTSTTAAPSTTAAATTQAAAAETQAPAETEAQAEPAGDPIHISMFYADNPTLPWMDSWLAVQEVQKVCNVELEVEALPSGSDFNTKCSLVLNTGENCPDVILYRDTSSAEYSSLAMNGAIVPISDYADWTPEFNARVQEFGLQDAVDAKKLLDGKRYYMPRLYDKPFYDGGLIMRQDYLEAKGFDDPKTFDDLYEILKAYKEDYPDSYPLTTLVAPYVTYRMTMPSWGIRFGKSNAGGGGALSWDYDKQEWFPAAISDQARDFLGYFHKLYAEGLLDPEMAATIPDDVWSGKLADGRAMATYAYYDQIGGVEAASDIEGFKLQMYPPLEGPAGAHHQQKASVDVGIMFPASTAKRDDFEQVVRAIDKMFYSEECSTIWCIGVEGVTYTMDGDTIVYNDDILNAPEGIYKYMQLEYGCGADPTQHIWINEREMTKYDENYAEINAKVAAMDDAIQEIPPAPIFDDFTAEDAATITTPLADAIEVWIDAFVTGTKSLDTDWDAYVAELKNLQIEELCQMYNDNMVK